LVLSFVGYLFLASALMLAHLFRRAELEAEQKKSDQLYWEQVRKDGLTECK